MLSLTYRGQRSLVFTDTLHILVLLGFDLLLNLFFLRIYFLKLFSVVDIENLFIIVQVDAFLRKLSSAITGFLVVSSARGEEMGN